MDANTTMAMAVCRGLMDNAGPRVIQRVFQLIVSELGDVEAAGHALAELYVGSTS